MANFVWPTDIKEDKMTDIAVDQDGKMIGISFTRVYSVDPQTAKCTYLSNLDRSFNGMSFVIGKTPKLVGAAGDGTLYEIDPASGKTSPLGQFGAGLRSSGDLVSISGVGTFATVVKSTVTAEIDKLAQIDEATGKATVIGETGFRDVWGLGYFRDKIYGFTKASELVELDRRTGKGRLVSSSGPEWWGAGVTTSAP